MSYGDRDLWGDREWFVMSSKGVGQGKENKWLFFIFIVQQVREGWFEVEIFVNVQRL